MTARRDPIAMLAARACVVDAAKNAAVALVLFRLKHEGIEVPTEAEQLASRHLDELISAVGKLQIFEKV